MKLWKTVAVMLAIELVIVLTVGAVRRMIWRNPCAPLIYARPATIVGVEYDNDLYIIEDGAGIVWIWEGVEDLSCGDEIAMLMFNHLTPWTIYDDMILDIA